MNIREIRGVVVLCASVFSPQRKAGRALRENGAVVIIEFVPHASGVCSSVVRSRIPATISVKRTVLAARGQRVSKRGQVAQVVERSPEKAGVGGSTPSLATTFCEHLFHRAGVGNAG